MHMNVLYVPAVCVSPMTDTEQGVQSMLGQAPGPHSPE